MTEKLNQNDVLKLKDTFDAEQHQFIRGFAYITEDAIADRIEQVDPAWNLRHVETRRRFNDETQETVVAVTVELEIKGAVRVGVGMAKVGLSKMKEEDKRKETPPLRTEVNEAEKAAATDAFKRAARLFGIGRYLLTLPQNVRNENALAKWLTTQSGAPQDNPRKVNTSGKQPPQKKAPTNGNPLMDTKNESINLSDVVPDSTHWDDTLEAFNLLINVDEDGSVNEYRARNSWKKISDKKHKDYLFEGLTDLNMALERMLERRCRITYGFQLPQMSKIADWAEIDNPTTKEVWRNFWMAVREVASSPELLQSVLGWDLKPENDVPF